ncbi:MAG: hypothetical protein MJ146_00540 [Clostridia bacterium]|nr:hypothetical protein [Clostridia bacterium]
MKKNRVLTIVGLFLLVAGLICIKLDGQVYPYIMVGLGCGLFGQGLGEIITKRTEKNHPDIARQREVEENDERNILIRDKAQAKAYRLMITLFGALILSFGLMQVELKVILLLVFAYLYVCGCSIYYGEKLRKEM